MNSRRRTAALAFSTTIALATVLAELILCEISDMLAAVRIGALKVTVPTLLFFLVVAIPFLEVQSLISSAGWDFGRSGKGRIPRVAWALQAVGFAAWLMGFWWLGRGLPGTYIYEMASQKGKTISEACLERVGVIGISLMALLSGFASVSSPWQDFGVQAKPVTEADLARKQAGLDATNDMLGAKRSRLRALNRKMSDAPQPGFMGKVLGNIRGNVDVQERQALQLEISGLETMAHGLSTSLSVFQARHATQTRSSNVSGRFLNLTSHIFSVYCIYRVFATLLTTIRRYHAPTTTFSSTDPINRILSLLAKHVDPSLDQLAWARQISFLLSGVILIASFNSVLQTFHLFSKIPVLSNMLYQAQANMALLVAQISATYVISSALLLRSNLPREVGSVISEALGSPLEPIFVDRWFEGWFLVASAGTAIGILLGRKLGVGSGEWDDCDEDMEMQKRS